MNSLILECTMNAMRFLDYNDVYIENNGLTLMVGRYGCSWLQFEEWEVGETKKLIKLYISCLIKKYLNYVLVNITKKGRWMIGDLDEFCVECGMMLLNSEIITFNYQYKMIGLTCAFR